MKCCGFGGICTDDVQDTHIRQAGMLDRLPFLSLCFRALSGFSLGWEKFGCYCFNPHKCLMSFTHTSWQKLLSDLSQLFSLPLSLSPRKFNQSAYFVLSSPSHFPSLPRSAATWPTRSITPNAKDSLFEKECLAQQWRNDLVMWHLAEKSLFWDPAPTSTEISEGLPVSLNQLGSGPPCTSGCSLFKCICTIPPFIRYYFLKGLRKASALHLTLRCFMILFQ